MSLDAILDELGLSEENHPESNDKSTPVRGVGIPEEKGHYAKSFYNVLSSIEEDTVYHRDCYDDADNLDIVTLYNEYEDSYDLTLAIGPVDDTDDTDDTEDSLLTIYIIGVGSEPVDVLAEVAARTAQTETGDYFQFPTVETVSDAEDLGLGFGQAVAIKETQEVYIETSM
jgi:hypothetical protein